MRLNPVHVRQWSTGNLSWLYVARLMHNLAYNFWSLFGPVYLVIQFDGRIDTYALFYLLLHLIYFVLLPILSPRVLQGDLRKPMYFAIPLIVLYYILLYFMPMNVMLVAGAILIVIPVFRSLYWPPYHAQVAEFSELANRGKQVNILFVLMAFIGIFMPILSGLIADRWGFTWLLLPAITLYLLSYFPLRKLKPIAEFYSWSFFETIRYFFHSRNRRMVVTYAAEGINDAGGLFIWPIVLWGLLGNNTVNMGLLVGGVVFAVVILRLLLASYIDTHSKRMSLRLGTYGLSLAWLARIFVVTPFQIFISDALKRLSNAVLKTSFDTLMYAKAADSDNYVDEYTVIREMSINVGRVLLFAVMMVSYMYVPEWWVTCTLLTISLSALLLRWQDDASS